MKETPGAEASRGGDQMMEQVMSFQCIFHLFFRYVVAHMYKRCRISPLQCSFHPFDKISFSKPIILSETDIEFIE